MSDVLVVNRGVALLRTEIRVIEAVSEVGTGDGPKKPAGAAGRLVVFDDGTSCEVAVAGADVGRLHAVASRSRAAG